MTIEKAQGHVCWDATQGAKGCGDHSAMAIRNGGGRTYFSVRDTRDKFADNQGYLEFDVRLQ